MLGQYETMPTPEERRLRYWSLDDKPTAIKKWIPNGILAFRVYQSYGSGPYWKETVTRRLEERLDDVVTALVALLEKRHREALEAAERHRQWEEEKRVREEAEALRRHEFARSRRLLKLAATADKSRLIRNLCSDLQLSPGSDHSERLATFIEWALQVADRLDPLTAILRDIEADKDPVQPDHEDLYPRD